MEDWIQQLDKRVSQLERQRTYLIASGTRRITVKGTAPAGPGTNDLWVDTTGPDLKIWTGSAWVTV